MKKASILMVLAGIFFLPIMPVFSFSLPTAPPVIEELTIGGPEDHPVLQGIRLTYPNGGEDFLRGQTYRIKWESLASTYDSEIREKDNTLKVAIDLVRVSSIKEKPISVNCGKEDKQKICEEISFQEGYNSIIAGKKIQRIGVASFDKFGYDWSVPENFSLGEYFVRVSLFKEGYWQHCSSEKNEKCALEETKARDKILTWDESDKWISIIQELPAHSTPMISPTPSPSTTPIVFPTAIISPFPTQIAMPFSLVSAERLQKMIAQLEEMLKYLRNMLALFNR